MTTFASQGPSGVGIILLLVGLLVLTPAAAATSVGGESHGTAAVVSATGSTTVDIAATPSFSFVPDSFTVAPGESVTLVVTQEADFNHTFTLSSEVNASIPTSDSPSQVAAFFNAHAPLVNVSLGSTPGKQFTETFTAPATPGTYEFLCLIHFATMTGVMSDTSSVSSSSGGSGLSTVEIVAIGAVVAVVVIALVVVLVRRGPRKP